MSTSSSQGQTLKDDRDDHAFYFTILGLIAATSSFLITALAREDVRSWWNVLFGISINFCLVAIFGVTVASLINYWVALNMAQPTINCAWWLRILHLIFHLLLLFAVAFTLAGVNGAMWYSDRLQGSLDGDSSAESIDIIALNKLVRQMLEGLANRTTSCCYSCAR